MFRIWLVLVLSSLFAGDAFALSVVSWNTKHLGRKGFDYGAAAQLLRGADLVMIQEVNTGEGGAKALTDLARRLSDAAGSVYCSAVSEIPTDGRERYGYIWRADVLAYVKTSGEPISGCPRFMITIHLVSSAQDKIVREPAAAVFLDLKSKKKFVAGNVHAVPTAKRPETEIGPIFSAVSAEGGKKLPRLLAGDFNLDSGHPAFAAAAALGFKGALAAGTKTSLKRKTRAYSKAYDNVFLTSGFVLRRAEVLDVYSVDATKGPSDVYKTLSDHAPVRVEVDLE